MPDRRPWKLGATAPRPRPQVLQSQAAIGHTRWATHGGPAAINSHPHTSGNDNEFVVVHNGIITNHQALKEFLVPPPPCPLPLPLPPRPAFPPSACLCTLKGEV